MKRILFFLLFLTSHLQAEEENESACLSNYEGDISGIVNGICVISGDYNMSETDYSIPGTTPIEYQRSYNSHELQCEPAGSMEQINGPLWKNNCYSKLTIHDIKWKDIRKCLVFHAPLKGGLTFLKQNVDQNFKFYFDINYPANNGYTNTSSGSPLGQGHIKTVSIPCQTTYDADLYFDFQNGSNYHYRRLSQDNNHMTYHPIAFTNSIGTISLFSYHHTLTKQTAVMFLNNARNNTLGGIVLYPDHNEDPFFSNKIVFSDGQEVKFEYCKLPAKINHKKHKDFYYLTSVQRPHLPKVNYEYAARDEKHRILSKVIHPEGRFQQIEYYKPGKNYILGDYAKTELPKKSPSLYRIKETKSPSSFDGKAVVTHAFFYDLIYRYDQKNRPHYQGGATEVVDANRHLTKYYHDSFHFLTGIERYLGNKRFKYSFYSKEILQWDTGGKLIVRALLSAGRQVHYVKKYIYDGAGNVLRDIYFGNLSGQGPLMSLDKHGNIPRDDSIERWTKTYTYDDTKFHHILSETEWNRATFFEYIPNTSLLASKITMCGGYTVAREYHAYDENGTLIETISDDGTSSNKEDLSGVSQRLISRIHPKMTGHGIGLPLEQWNLYIELDSREEKLLSHHVNTYNDDYRLVSRAHFDSEENYLYTLTWEYDRYGNVIAETDPLGYKTFSQYDENSNLTWEQSPSGILTKEHTYDYCNRLIRTNLRGADGTMLSTTNTYDVMGRLISAQNHRGETSTYTYDEFDRLISLTQPAIYDSKGILVTPIETYTYDAMGRKTSSTDGRGFITRKEYNAYGSVTRTIHADGTEESAIYNLDNTIKESKARNGTVTKYVFDTLKHPLSIEVYDAIGNPGHRTLKLIFEI